MKVCLYTCTGGFWYDANFVKHAFPWKHNWFVGEVVDIQGVKTLICDDPMWFPNVNGGVSKSKKKPVDGKYHYRVFHTVADTPLWYRIRCAFDKHFRADFPYKGLSGTIKLLFGRSVLIDGERFFCFYNPSKSFYDFCAAAHPK